MSNDVLSNLASKIRNGLSSEKLTVEHIVSHETLTVIEILESEGFINGYTLFIDDKNNKVAKIFLKYHKNKPAIQEIKRVSKPGKRVYTDLKDFKNTSRKMNYISNGSNNKETSLYILSTNKGILSHKTAYKLLEGGELLLKIS